MSAALKPRSGTTVRLTWCRRKSQGLTAEVPGDSFSSQSLTSRDPATLPPLPWEGLVLGVIQLYFLSPATGNTAALGRPRVSSHPKVL